MAISMKRLAVHLLAVGVPLAAIGSAHAVIVYSGVVNINIPSTVDGVYLNVVSGAFSTSASTAPSGWDVNLWSNAGLRLFTPPVGPGGGAYVGSGSDYTLLPIGFIVGQASSFCSTGIADISPSTPLNLNSGSNLIGFRFRNEVTGNQIHYGWMRVALGATAGGQPRSIVEYAYEDVAGQPVFFPPSPGTAGPGLLAIALGARRRRSA